MDAGIPERVKALIASHIESVVRLEILLLLRRRPDEELSASDVAGALRIDPAWAGPHLAELCAREMLSCSKGQTQDSGQGGPEQGPRYRFAPGSASLREAIDELAKCYAERRVSVTALIFSMPPSPLRSFADAFRLRRDQTDG